MLVLRDLWDLCTSTCAARVRAASRGSLPVPEVRPDPGAPYSLSVQTVIKRPRETATPPRKLRLRGVPFANPLDTLPPAERGSHVEATRVLWLRFLLVGSAGLRWT
eukprot:1389417-Heterocapsa_arctica.AAC.1